MMNQGFLIIDYRKKQADSYYIINKEGDNEIFFNIALFLFNITFHT